MSIIQHINPRNLHYISLIQLISPKKISQWVLIVQWTPEFLGYLILLKDKSCMMWKLCYLYLILWVTVSYNFLLATAFTNKL